MEYSRFLDCLASDFARLRAVVDTDLTAAVPSCPGWTVADLTYHVGEVYLHKTLAIQEGVEPDPWPPKELADEDPIALLDRAYAGLLDEFSIHKPEDPAGTLVRPQIRPSASGSGGWRKRRSSIGSTLSSALGSRSRRFRTT
jgi:hypothetical protein